MKRISLIFSILVLCSTSLFAQGAPTKAPAPKASVTKKVPARKGPLTAAALPNSTSLSWTLSITTGATYNVYKAPCTGFVQGTGTGTVTGVGTCTTPGTFVKLTTTPLSSTTTTYVDTAVTPNSAAAYEVTTVCATGGACPSTTAVPSESIPSNIIAALTPGNQPQPPTLSITTVTKVINPNNTQTVVAKWTDTNLIQQYFAFTNGSLFLAQGLTSSSTGSFAEEWTGPTTTTVTFIAVDAVGESASQKVM